MNVNSARYAELDSRRAGRNENLQSRISIVCNYGIVIQKEYVWKGGTVAVMSKFLNKCHPISLPSSIYINNISKLWKSLSLGQFLCLLGQQMG